jgi:hypothetical protein
MFSGNSITKQMYNSLRKEVDWEYKHPTGVILHAAAFDDSGNNNPCSQCMGIKRGSE